MLHVSITLFIIITIKAFDIFNVENYCNGKPMFDFRKNYKKKNNFVIFSKKYIYIYITCNEN